MSIDDERVGRCLKGDTSAFEELVEAHQRALFNVALRVLRDREEARDATQSAFVSAWRHLDRYQGRDRFFGWIHRILMNEALSRLRRRRVTIELDETFEDPAPGAESRVTDGEVSRRLDGALRALSIELREVVVLRHWLDLSYDEMADMLGIPARTVKSRLFTARRRLGALLRHQGVHP